MTGMDIDGPALLRLLQLASPALPIGAYSYSQGMEWAIEAGWLRDEETVESWLAGLLSANLGRIDAPVFARLYRAWRFDDRAALMKWNSHLVASRESRELREEELHLGQSLAKLLWGLGIERAGPWGGHPRACLATAFSLAAVEWRIGMIEALSGYLWSWLENQVLCAVKLIPLGQLAGQQLLSRLSADRKSVV